MASEVKGRIKDDKLYFIENCLFIIDKHESLIPFKLWPAQRYYVEHRTNRNVMLKNRQQGCSSGVMADYSHPLFTKSYQRDALIAHDDETAEYLFQTIQRFYHNLPWNKGRSSLEMEPKTDWKSGRRMRFDKLDSYIYVDSAKSDSLGIGHTLSVAHLSEIAKWPYRKAKQLFADITNTVPEDGLVTAESTPMGRFGIFYELCQSAKLGEINYTYFFFPWWWDISCTRADPEWLLDKKGEVVARKLNIPLQELKKQEQAMSEQYNLSPQQLTFRRVKIAELGLLFFQEFPESDIDCWLSTEMAVIDGTLLKSYYTSILPGKQDGWTTIWKDVMGGEKYVIGADVASGAARDYSVASVLKAKNLEYVARIRGKIPTDIFAEEIYRLSKRYNDAIIAVERIGHGHSVLRVLLEKNANLYYHTDYDQMLKANVTDAGWNTTAKSKMPMINDLARSFRSGDLISYSENLIDEASKLVWEGGVDTRVRSDGSDDEVMAIAIAIQVRESMPVWDTNYQRPVVRTYAKVF